MSRYNDIFDKIEPETSNGEFLSEIKGMRKTRQKYIRKIIPVLVSAVVLIISSTTVSAYYSGLFDPVRSFFSDKNNILPDDIDRIDISASENTFEHLGFDVTGGVCDGKFTVIFIDVTRNDNKIFDNSDYILSDEKGNEIILSDGTKFTMKPSVKFLSDKSCSVTSNGISMNETRRCYLVNDDNVSDNKITLAYCISDIDREIADKFRLELGNMYSEKSYGIPSGSSVILKSMSKESFSGRFVCEIDLDDISDISDRMTIQPDVTAELPVIRQNSVQTKEHKFNVKEISVSSVTVNIRLEGERSDDSEYIQVYGYESIGKIILNDGTVLPFGSEASPKIIIENTENDKWYFEGDFVLPQTINIDDIKEIIIGDETILIS